MSEAKKPVRFRRFVSLALALLMLCGMAPAALAAEAGLENFQQVNSNFTGKFTDVPQNAWYAESVKTAYELGLIAGESDTLFAPNGNITIAATLALACRLHSIYNTGVAEFVQGTPWYAVYVDYAVENGIITQGQYSAYEVSATRRQFASILAKALPADALSAMNTVDDGMIPDVAMDSQNAAEIYMLYRAGILTGNDEAGTFTPEASIDRASVAAIITRMAVPALRRSVTLRAVPVTGITLNASTLTLEAGKTQTLTAAVAPADATAKALSWTSSNEAVATVSGGTVTAVSAGSATITCTAASGVTAECAVTVTPAPVAATGVTLDQTSATLSVGRTLQLNATVTPADATDKTVTWAATGAVSVSSSGLVTANRVGSGTVTATVGDVTAQCRITVQDLGAEIVLRDSLPITLYEYDYRDDLESSWQVTDFRYTSEKIYDGTYTVEMYFSGTKTFDVRGSGQGDTCRISWQLFDVDGYVIDSGTIYSPSVREGESFRDAHEYIFDLNAGTYYLELSSTN